MFDTVLAFDYIDGARDNNTHRNTNPNQNQAAFGTDCVKTAKTSKFRLSLTVIAENEDIEEMVGLFANERVYRFSSSLWTICVLTNAVLSAIKGKLAPL